MYKTLVTNMMVEDVNRSLSFYKDILGFLEEAVVPGEDGKPVFAIMVKDGLYLMIQEKNSLVAEYSVMAADKIKPTITLYITVDDLDLLYSEIKKKYPVYKDPYITSYGAREFAVLDPDGYALTFAKYEG